MPLHKSKAEDVVPIPLSDLEFGPEMDKINAVLDDKGNWEKRHAALRRLHGICLADISTKKNFANVMSNTVKITLKAQIADLRSAISREACEVVKALCTCSENKASWEFCSEWFLPALFANSCATVAAIAQAADATLMIIAKCGNIGRDGLLCFFKHCGNKHNVIRRVAFQSLLYILLSVSSSVMSRHSERLCEIVRVGLTDAVQETRKLSRMCFWALDNVCTDEAVEVYMGCEPQVQRALDSEKDAFAQFVETGEAPARVERKDSLADSLGREKPPAASATNSRRASAAATSKRRPSSSSAVRPPTGGDAAVHQDPMAGASPPPQGETQGTSPLPRTQSYAAQQQRRRVGVPAAQRRASAPTAVPANNTPDATSLGVAPTAEDSWFQIESGIKSSDWATRVNAFNGIAELVDLNALAPSRFGDAMALVLRHIGDSHYRVSCASMLCLEKLLQLHADKCFPHLENMLVSLMGRLNDPKEPVRAQARRVLEQVPYAFSPDAVLQPALRVVEQPNAKVRLSAVEYVHHLMENSQGYFNQATAMKAFLQKLLVVATRYAPNDNKIVSAVSQALAQLYSCNPELFVATAQGLQTVDREAVAKLVQQRVPHIQQDFRRATQGERLLPHPEVQSRSPFKPSPARESQLQESTKVTRRSRLVESSVNSPAQVKPAQRASPQEHRPSTANRRSARAEATSPTPGGYDVDAYDGASSRNADAQRASHSRHEVSPKQTTFAALLGHQRDVPDEVAALRDAASSEEKRLAILDAGDSLTLNPRLWEDHYSKLFSFPLAFAKDVDHTIRLLAIQWLHAIAETRPLLAEHNDASLEHFLRSAAIALDDPYPEIQREAFDVMRAALSNCHPSVSIHTLITIIDECCQAREVPLRTLRTLLEELGKTVTTIGRDRTEEWADAQHEAVDCLTRCFGSESSDIRKAVVLTFVDFYFVLGDSLLPRLRHLSVSQLKLISIYCNRQFPPGAGQAPVDLMHEMSKRELI